MKQDLSQAETSTALEPRREWSAPQMTRLRAGGAEGGDSMTGDGGGLS